MKDCQSEFDSWLDKWGYSRCWAVVLAWKKVRLSAEKRERRKPLSPSQKWSLLKRQRGACARCGDPITYQEATDDHIVPVAHGGTNDLKNRRLVCAKCNSEKSDKTLLEESKSGHGTFVDQLGTEP